MDFGSSSFKNYDKCQLSLFNLKIHVIFTNGSTPLIIWFFITQFNQQISTNLIFQESHIENNIMQN